jgi:hypothetical protein
MMRKRRSSRLSLMYFVVLTGLLLGGSVWLDRQGQVVVATVDSKLEQVTVQHVPKGEWFRWYRVGVAFLTRDGAQGMATVEVPEEQFDELHRGDRLSIRYLPALPLLARTTDRLTAQVIWDVAVRSAVDDFVLPFLLWLGLGAMALWVASRLSTVAVFAIGAVWIAAAFLMLFRPAPPLRPVIAETSARVEAVTLVTKSPARGRARRRSIAGGGDAVRRLAVPYQVVQLRLAVPGRQDSVLAVDAVDSASVPGLAVGATAPVRYNPAAPREAQLAKATRTFRARNRYHFLIPIVGLGVLAVLAAWGVRTQRARPTA